MYLRTGSPDFVWMIESSDVVNVRSSAAFAVVNFDPTRVASGL